MLTSSKNPLVKQIRKLQRSSERHKQNLCLLEGTNLLETAYQVKYPLVTVMATCQWQEKNLALWKGLQTQTDKLEIVSEEIIKTIATTVNPDGVIATARRPQLVSLPPPIKLGLVLETIQDPGNLGTIIRTSVAMGVSALWLSNDSVDLDHPKVLRASAGEWFKIKAYRESNLPRLVTHYRESGLQIIAASLTGKMTQWDLDFSQPSLILLGNEAHGLSANLADLATHQVKIPLVNQVESLNVAIATAFILAEYQRQQSCLEHLI
jgi:TrmH family RNA methyltransferase